MNAESTNIVWHRGEVTAELRKARYGHAGLTVWLTGLSGSGKSTIAMRTERLLIEAGKKAYVLDGDNVRYGLNGDLDFSPEGRTENIRRIGHVARLFCDAGIIVLAAFISPFESNRRQVREIHPPGAFIEVHVAPPMDVCEERDPKGLYKKARAGIIDDFTGVQSPYEPPSNPDLVLDTSMQDVDQSAQTLLALINKLSS